MSEENVWTINRCLTWTRDYLARKGDEHARLSAEWLLSAATGKDRTGLYMAFDEPLSADELTRMHGFIERRAKGEPLQYITGKTSFRFIDVACAPGVLIPRPETELLVDAALEVLVSNPPYIPDDVMRELPEEVADYEPELALAGGVDGLDVYRRLLALAPKALVPGGMLAVELHEDALDAAAALAREQGCWKSVEIRRDLTGRTRFIVAALAGGLPAVVPAREPEGRIVECSQDEPAPEVVADAAAVLRDGGVVVLPTDSVYGIGAAATPSNPGHRRIFDIKRRDLAQTLPLLVSDASELDRLAIDVPSWARSLAERLWPGPLAVTSANTHGMPAPATSADIERRIAESADLTLAAGPTPAGAASTIVDTTSGEPRIVRQGPIPAEAIAALAR